MQNYSVHKEENHRLFGREISNIINPQSINRIPYFRRKQLNTIRGISDDLTKKNTKLKISLNRISCKDNSIVQYLIKNKPQSNILDNPQFVPEYLEQNLKFMIENQSKKPKLTNYFDFQTDISKNMREILVDWLLDIHLKFKMFPETLFMVINIIDQYLAKVQISRIKLQLVGIAALYIAAKYEQTYSVPTLSDLVSLCNKTYSKDQIKEMEASILKCLNFDLVFDSSYKFLQPLARIENMEQKNFYLCRYVLQISLFNISMIKYRPSLLAASTIYLINKIRNKNVGWSDLMITITGYEQQQIKSCAKQLCILLQNVNHLTNGKVLKRKFSMSSYYEVTRIKLEKRQRADKEKKQ